MNSNIAQMPVKLLQYCNDVDVLCHNRVLVLAESFSQIGELAVCIHHILHLVHIYVHLASFCKLRLFILLQISRIQLAQSMH